MQIGLGLSIPQQPAPAIAGGPGVGVDNLLLETGDNLLLESGGVILLE